MKLIVGLGNPGSEYQDTRHNIGFMVLDKLSKELGTTVPAWENDKKHNALAISIGGVMLVKPQTFMNRSGAAVKSLMDYYKLTPEDVWVIHDDIDLPMGKIRIREKGASGGHNGMDSVIKALGTDSVIRFRMGIGRGDRKQGSQGDRQGKQQKIVSFVLSRFSLSEAGAFKHLIKNGTQAVRVALSDGVDKAMNRYN